MPMDVDYIVASDAIKELDALLCGIEHGEREAIADDICAFVEQMKQKYS